MKCRLLNDEAMVNPVYLEAADKKGIQQQIQVPAGTILDTADAWMLCVLGKAAPADDECRAKLNAYLGDPRRKILLEKIRRLKAAEGTGKLDAKTKKWLDYMSDAYAGDLEAAELAAVDAQ